MRLACRCWCVCWSVFSGLQWGDCRVLKLHCDSSRAYRMGENWQALRYYMCSRSPSLCLTGALGMKGKSSGKRDIGSRHGEVFVSILSIPSLSRNPNFHHSPTYRQIKAGWRGGFPQLRQLVTSLHKGGKLHKALEWEEVGAQISNCFEFEHTGGVSCSKGHFHRGWSETWLGISELRVRIRTVTHDMRLSANPEYSQKNQRKDGTRERLSASQPCLSLCWGFFFKTTFIKAVFFILEKGGGWCCLDGDVQVQGMPGLAADVLNAVAWH